jgi:plastocyanin
VSERCQTGVRHVSDIGRTRLGCLAAALIVAAAGCAGDSPSGPTPPGADATTITISAGGVSPTSIVVKPGSQVTFFNTDSRNHNMSSDPHPEHDDCPAVNDVGVLVPGQKRQTGNLNTVQTCGFHDHDDFENNRWKGSITIQ